MINPFIHAGNNGKGAFYGLQIIVSKDEERRFGVACVDEHDIYLLADNQFAREYLKISYFVESYG